MTDPFPLAVVGMRDTVWLESGSSSKKLVAADGRYESIAYHPSLEAVIVVEESGKSTVIPRENVACMTPLEQPFVPPGAPIPQVSSPFPAEAPLQVPGGDEPIGSTKPNGWDGVDLEHGIKDADLIGDRNTFAERILEGAKAGAKLAESSPLVQSTDSEPPPVGSELQTPPVSEGLPEASPTSELACPSCGKQLKTAAGLKSHIRNKHGGVA